MSPAKTRRRPRRQNLIRVLFVLPALILFAVVMLVPIGANSFYAFTNWGGFGANFDIVGFDNFARLLGDRTTGTAFLNTVIFTAVNAPLQILLGLLLAVALRVPGRVVVFLRVVVVIPIAVSGVVLGFIGTIVFDPTTGLLHAASLIPGLEALGQNWLGDPQLAMAAVIAMNLWQWSGFTMLIFLAALAGIPDELYEAAKLDGATAWQQFRYITWPQLAPATTVNIVLTIIGGFKVFDIIYVLTGGGPGDATRSVVMQVVTQGGFSNYGYSATISVTLTVLILVIALGALALLRRRERSLS